MIAAERSQALHLPIIILSWNHAFTRCALLDLKTGTLQNFVDTAHGGVALTDLNCTVLETFKATLMMT
jgi:hypothetical protein